MVKAPTKSFDELHPAVRNPIKLTSDQRASYLQNIPLDSVGPNEMDLACLRVPSDIQGIATTQLLRTIIEDWRLEAVPSTRMPMTTDARKAAHRESDRLAARRLLEGSKALADMDALEEASRLAEDAAIASRKALEALYFELTSLPKKLEQLQDYLNAVADERSRLNLANLEAEYTNLFTARFEGRNTFGDLDKIWITIQQCEKRLAILDRVEKDLINSVSDLKKREKAIRKELGL